MIAALGSVLLALCGLPQALKAYRKPWSTRGLSWSFLAAWGVGELCLFCALWPAARAGAVPWIVLANYATNAGLVAYIAGVKASQERARS